MNHLKRKWIIFQPSILRGYYIFVFRRDKVGEKPPTSAATTYEYLRPFMAPPKKYTNSDESHPQKWRKSANKFLVVGKRIISHSLQREHVCGLEVAGWSWMKRGHYITNLNNVLFFSGNHSMSDHRFAFVWPLPRQKKWIIHNSIIPNESLKLWFLAHPKYKGLSFWKIFLEVNLLKDLNGS